MKLYRWWNVCISLHTYIIVHYNLHGGYITVIASLQGQVTLVMFWCHDFHTSPGYWLCSWPLRRQLCGRSLPYCLHDTITTRKNNSLEAWMYNDIKHKRIYNSHTLHKKSSKAHVVSKMLSMNFHLLRKTYLYGSRKQKFVNVVNSW